MNEIINFGDGKKVKVIMLKGESGNDGRGIVSVQKTSSLGRVDTYTMTFTDGTTFNYDVTNGAGHGDVVDTVNGMSGNVVLGASDVGALPDTTTLADLTQDSTHRTVTDTEKASWNGKVDSVNGQTGTVVLGASEVGALPSDTTLAELPQNSAYRTVSDAEKEKWNKASDGKNNNNIFYNPWFTINQRYLNSYTGSGYTVDRWKKDSGTVTVNNGYINVNLGAGVRFYQPLEPKDLEYGKKYTISLMLLDGSVYSGQIIASSEDVNIILGTIGGHSIRGGIDGRNASTKWIVYFDCASAWNIDIKAVKLEVGEQSSLINDTPPDEAVELLKCKRFYQFGSLSYKAGRSYTTRALFNLFGLVDMRTNPTANIVTNAPWIQIKSSTGFKNANITGIVDAYTNYIHVSFDENAIEGETCFAQFSFEYDAEL